MGTSSVPFETTTSQGSICSTAKDCWKERDEPHDLLVKPLEKGLSYKIGEWCFNTMIDPVVGASESMSKPYIDTLEDEDAVWFLEDLISAAELSGLFNPAGLEPIANRIGGLDELYENDEGAYWSQIGGAGRRQHTKMFGVFCTSQAEPLAGMRALYAPEIADVFCTTGNSAVSSRRRSWISVSTERRLMAFGRNGWSAKRGQRASRQSSIRGIEESALPVARTS